PDSAQNGSESDNLRQRAAGSGQRAAGSGQRAAGSGQRAAGSGQRAAGGGQPAAGSGQLARVAAARRLAAGRGWPFLPRGRSSTGPGTAGRGRTVTAYRRPMPRDLTRYRGALLHRSRWLHLGVHARDLASDRFTTVFPGYLPHTEHPAPSNALARATQNRRRPRSVRSHTTAARRWGIPLPWRLEDGVGMLRLQELAPDVEDPVLPAVLPGLTLGVDASLPLLHCRVAPGSSSRVGRGVVVHRQ